ncbi:MAG: 3-dehydroquinate synthase [Thermomicrobiales bacterium]
MTTEEIVVRTEGQVSVIRIGAGEFDALGATLAAQAGATGRAFVISDETVWALYGARLLATLEQAEIQGRATTVPAGEGTKSLAQAGALYDWLAAERAERRDPVIAVGGGVTGDLAGFVAATYLRGVPLVQAPTTLLAMVDSAVGGKTGVNLAAGKNLVGAFYQAGIVAVDPALLATLPPRELATGWAEVIKYAGFDRSVPGLEQPPLWPILQERGADLRALRDPVTTQVIAACLRVKAAVVMQDERETGLRRVLNLGHTIGHAIEAVAGYGRYTHGEAVALGLRGVYRLSVRLGLLELAEQVAFERLLNEFGLPAHIEGCASAALLDRIGSDKKVRAGRVHWILPCGPGEVVIRDDVPPDAVRAVLFELGAG